MDTQGKLLLNPKRQLVIVLLSALIAQSAIADSCPVTECNYLDESYQAAFSQFLSCTNNVTEKFNKYMGFLAIVHPRFGIAWIAYWDEMKSALHSDGTADSGAMKVAKQRFDDRILRTAETEALESYNLATTKMSAELSGCGAMPQPPKGQPAPIK